MRLCCKDYEEREREKKNCEFSSIQTHGRDILQLLQDVFSLLPIATVIDNKVLIVHGGISDKTDLDFLSFIERDKVGL